MGQSASRREERARQLAEQRARHSGGPVAADLYGGGVRPALEYMPSASAGAGTRLMAPTTESKTKAVKSQINLRKNSLRLVKEDAADGAGGGGRYCIEFEVDAHHPYEVELFYMATEHVDANGMLRGFDSLATASGGSPAHRPRFAAGLKQPFKASDVRQWFDAGLAGSADDDPSRQLFFDRDSSTRCPIVVQLTVLDEDGVEAGADDTTAGGSGGQVHVGQVDRRQGQTVFVTFTGSKEGGVSGVRLVAKKMQIDGQNVEIHELFGLGEAADASAAAAAAGGDAGADANDDQGLAECVICMCEPPDTAILPCRHMCVCKDCALQLRMQQNNVCPICRNRVERLLHIKK